MKSRTQKIVLAFVPLLILAFIYIWQSLHRPPLVTPLSVTFTGWVTNPMPRMAPLPRVAVGPGATGICAMFWVTNAGASNETLWFDTAQVEQKIDGKWHPWVPFPAPNPWRGIEGRVWFGGYGCWYAVGWPPGLPTNATWRLRLRCGPDRSGAQLVIQEKLGRDVFERKSEHKENYNVVMSSEVVP